LPIHREAPAFVEQETEQQILVTGIKVFSSFSFLLSFILSLLLRFVRVTCLPVLYDWVLIFA